MLYFLSLRSHNLNKWDLYDDLSYIIDYATNNAVPDEVNCLIKTSSKGLGHVGHFYY